MYSDDSICPACGRRPFDAPARKLQGEFRCRHCGALLFFSTDPSQRESPILLVQKNLDGIEHESTTKTAEKIMPDRAQLLAARDWWGRAGIVVHCAWSGLKKSPSLFWPIAGAFLVSVTGLYVAEGIDSPLGLTGLILGPGVGLWLITMSVSAMALSLLRSGQRTGAAPSFGRSLRMLLEHRKRLSHRIVSWIALGALGAAASAVLVAVFTAVALFLPGSQILIGLFVGIEILAAAAMFPTSVLVGAGLAIQPIRACLPATESSIKSDLTWWKQSGEAKHWMATGLLLASAAAAVGLLLATISLEAVLELNQIVVPTDLREVLSASVLAPLLGIERAVEPSFGLQLAGAAASAGICGAVALLATPAAALWSAASAAAALVSGPETEVPPRD